MAIARIFFGLILIFLFVAFSLKNMNPISVDLYFRKTPELPLFVWLFFAALFGVIVAWLVAISEQLRMRRALKREKKEKKELEDKVEKLKKELEELEDRLSRQRAVLLQTEGERVEDKEGQAGSSTNGVEESEAEVGSSQENRGEEQ